MNLSFITRAAGAVKLAAKAHAPTIMVTTGVISMGASVIVASKKTLELDTLIAPHVEKLEEIDRSAHLVGYDEKAMARDRGRVYGRVFLVASKHYLVPSVLFVGGACLVFGGHRVMLKRNATLALAYTGLAKAFDAYRENVRQHWGDETDQAMMSGYRTVEVYDDAKKHPTEVNTRDWDNSNNPYARVFEQGETSQWSPDRPSNVMFIHNQQRFAQELLNRRGYLYLWEVYEALGFQPNDVSRVVGWKNKKLPDGSKEIAVVDFGLDKPVPDDWTYSSNGGIYLDFNCHGLIVGGKVQKMLEQA